MLAPTATEERLRDRVQYIALHVETEIVLSNRPHYARVPELGEPSREKIE
jgi:hypothetical protein